MSTRSRIFIKLNDELKGKLVKFDMNKLPKQSVKNIKEYFSHKIPNILIPDDASYMSVYHHYDGYPSGLGAELVKNYGTIDKVVNLLSLGDLSSILDEKVISYRGWRNDNTPPTFYNKSLLPYLYKNNKWKRIKRVIINTFPVEIFGYIVTPFRGKIIAPYVEEINVSQTLPEFKDEYGYLFDGEKWLFFDHQKPLKGWQNLAEHLCAA